MYDLIAVTSDLLVLIMCRQNFGSDFERRRHSTFQISKEYLQNHTKMCLKVSFKRQQNQIRNRNHLMGLMGCWTLIKYYRSMSRSVKLVTSFFLYSNLQHLEHCLIIPIDLEIYIQTSLCSWFTNCSKLLEPNTVAF